jgi:hypothetical protein
MLTVSIIPLRIKRKKGRASRPLFVHKTNQRTFYTPTVCLLRTGTGVSQL